MAIKGRACQGDQHWTRLRPHAVKRGSEVGNSKLTEDNVREIRARYFGGADRTSLPKFKHGFESMQKLADEFGVSKSLIAMIVNGQWWKHVEGEQISGST
jgi:hypothetical protein